MDNAQQVINGEVFQKVLLSNLSGEAVNPSGGGGGGGDTSNIKTNNTTAPTTSAMVGGLATDGQIKAFRATLDRLFACAMGEQATNGDIVYPEVWGYTMTYNADGTINVVTTTNTGVTPNVSYTRTFTYTSGRVNGKPKWVIVP